MPEWPEYMATDTTSRYIDVPVATLISWRQTGTGPEWIKIPPRLVRYPKASLDAWLASMRRKPAGTAPD